MSRWFGGRASNFLRGEERGEGGGAEWKWKGRSETIVHHRVTPSIRRRGSHTVVPEATNLALASTDAPADLGGELDLLLEEGPLAGERCPLEGEDLVGQVKFLLEDLDQRQRVLLLGDLAVHRRQI